MKAIITFSLLLISATLHAQWVSYPTQVSANLNAIDFVNTSTGYIVGNAGTLIKTTDGGLTWISLTIGSTATLSAIDFIDDTTGYVGGASGMLKKTTDGGLTWTTLTSNTTEGISDVCFTDVNHGYFTTQLGTVRKTVDGGTSWTMVSPGMQYSRVIDFIDATTGYIASSTLSVSKTTNAGASWSVLTLPNQLPISAIDFIDANVGYVICSSNWPVDTAVILKTNDGGSSWTTLNLPDNAIFLTTIGFTDATTGYAAGLNSYVIKTTDGGLTWTQQNSTISTFFSSISIVGASGFIVGTGGAFVKTTSIEQANPITIQAVTTGNDVHLTWTPATIPTDYYKVYENEVPIDIVAGTVTDYMVVHPCPGAYDYHVVSCDSTVGSSYSSNHDSATVTGGLTRNFVLIEGGTYPTCVHCPSSAMGIRDLIEGQQLNAVAIEYYNYSSYTNPFSLSRLDYYGIAGYPTVFFDGVDNFIGGGYNTTNYPYYRPLYDKCIDVPSAHDLNLTISMDSIDYYTAEITIDQGYDCLSNEWKLQTVLTESNVPEVWYNQTEADNICRGMYPSAAGTPLDFSSQSSQTVTVHFSTAGFVKDNCQFIAFVQHDPTHKVSGTIKQELSSPLGLPEFQQPEIALYPNPAGNSATFISGGNGQLEILDLNGKTVYTARISSHSQKIDLSGIQHGVYMARFTNEQRMLLKKLIVQ